MSHNNQMTSVVTPVAPEVQAPSASNVGAGEGRSLGDFYDRFGTLAYSLAFSITGQRSAAERVVAGAFATTWRSRHRDSSPSAFCSALMMTVRANALAGRRGARSPRDAVMTIRRFDGPHAAGSSSDATASAVAVALSNLPDAQRRVLMLAYFGGLALGEIASELHEPVERVKADLQAALRHLRSVLSERVHPAGLV